MPEYMVRLHFCGDCTVLRSPDLREPCDNCHSLNVVVGLFTEDGARKLLENIFFED